MLETLGGATSHHFKDMRALQRAQKARMQEEGEAARDWKPLKKERPPARRNEAQARWPLGRGAEGLPQIAL